MIEARAIKTEDNFDGKYVLRASDPTLATEDIALVPPQQPLRSCGSRERMITRRLRLGGLALRRLPYQALGLACSCLDN